MLQEPKAHWSPSSWLQTLRKTDHLNWLPFSSSSVLLYPSYAKLATSFFVSFSAWCGGTNTRGRPSGLSRYVPKWSNSRKGPAWTLQGEDIHTGLWWLIFTKGGNTGQKVFPIYRISTELTQNLISFFFFFFFSDFFLAKSTWLADTAKSSLSSHKHGTVWGAPWGPVMSLGAALSFLSHNHCIFWVWLSWGTILTDTENFKMKWVSLEKLEAIKARLLLERFLVTLPWT